MRLYRLLVAGRAHYVGTQAEARARKRETGIGWTEVDVPTSKADLIAFLNRDAPAPSPASRDSSIEARSIDPPRMRPAPTALDATSVLARMDNPNLGLDAIIEAIALMRGGYALKRVAGAVAIRFEQLSR